MKPNGLSSAAASRREWMRKGLAYGGWTAATLVTARAGAATLPLPALRAAAPVVRPERSVMIALTQAGSRLVAAGERGLVLWSDDGGTHWTQADVPTSVTLTNLCFISPDEGWAVGHGGVVLHTRDGGRRWHRTLLPRGAPAPVPGGGGSATVERPLFGLSLAPDRTGWACGAYGSLLHTPAGGDSWEDCSARLSNPKSSHLYGIARAGSMLYLAGEAGFFARSADQGRSFETIRTPYPGTYFSLAASGGAVYLGGLRGHLLVSRDQGRSFASLSTQTAVSISSMKIIEDETLLFANQAGEIWALGLGLSQPVALAHTGQAVSAFVTSGPKEFVTAGFSGLARVTSERDMSAFKETPGRRESKT
jgi:photosystem II stability/assembly factor-like uncharacterized protein